MQGQAPLRLITKLSLTFARVEVEDPAGPAEGPEVVPQVRQLLTSVYKSPRVTADRRTACLTELCQSLTKRSTVLPWRAAAEMAPSSASVAFARHSATLLSKAVAIWGK